MPLLENPLLKSITAKKLLKMPIFMFFRTSTLQLLPQTTQHREICSLSLTTAKNLIPYIS